MIRTDVIASPLTLLRQWQGREDQAPLEEFLLLGFTVDLPFLETVAIPAARALGARITVVGDAGQGLYEAVDVRHAGRTYLHALASCGRAAFHPKLALLRGGNDVVAAIGSGNPTSAGWGYNQEIWTVLRGRTDAALAGFDHLGVWLWSLADHPGVRIPGYIADVLRQNGDLLRRLPPAEHSRPDVEVLHNLDRSLLHQLPPGPVAELCLIAPFIDAGGHALRAVIEHFDPTRIILGLQRRRGSFDGDAIAAAVAGRDIELRELDDKVPRHGKLLEWSAGERRWALTGSANLTAAALLRSTADGGNCELAVLTSVPESLMPEGRLSRIEQIHGMNTVAPRDQGSIAAVVVLGALATPIGLLVTLAYSCPFDVIIEYSPDGAPNSWTALGVIEAGQTEGVFPGAQTVGPALRGVPVSESGFGESAPVFVVHPARCERRVVADDRPRMRREHTEDDLFADEESSRLFRQDLLRLKELLSASRQAIPASAATAEGVSATGADRWQAYLEDCERTFGRGLTASLFSLPTLALPGASGSRWTITAAVSEDEPEGGATPTDDAVSALDTSEIPESQRSSTRRWAQHIADDISSPRIGIAMKMLVARMVIRLLAEGTWQADDDTWRAILAAIVRALATDEESVPPEARSQAIIVIAVCTALLLQDVSLTGGTPEDLDAQHTWEVVRPLIAEVAPDTEPETDLLHIAKRPYARVVRRGELDDLIRLAHEREPSAAIIRSLAAEGWDITLADGVYTIHGGFRNPARKAAELATHLEKHLPAVQVRAGHAGRWAYVLWRRPDLVIAAAPGPNQWRYYRIDQSFATPVSRFSEEALLPQGARGATPLAAAPPRDALGLFDELGLDYVRLLADLRSM